MTISFKANLAEVNREIERLKKEEDAKACQVGDRLLMEGKNWAHQLVKKDTGALDTSIDTASRVEKIGDCEYAITLGNQMEYGSIQELDPKRGRPHIRPAVRVMQLRADGIFREVHEG